ncbi:MULTISPECIES: cation diffusion facilitator family transporter [Bacillus]|uniref:cation diffusion facilitator family transporter n=1 Tax=Bacillus TaxID=1386 RepID=UPI0002FB5676|nr:MULTISPECIES: cation diffusion facilitator family transporter [Bacillus]
MGKSHSYHGHSHNHSHSANKKALFGALLLITLFMVVEIIGGIVTNSLALLSDAGHMLSDSAALGLSLFALILGTKKATREKTYGYRRFEIIAAALNGITLILISLYIFYEAFQRFNQPPEIQSLGMLTISIIGLLVNIAAAWILMKGNKEENLNIKSAFLHVLGDMLGSVGAIAAAILIYFFDWNIADPIASIIVAILIIISGIRVLKDAYHILMEGTPFSIDIEEVKEKIIQIPNVVSVHDLHIWSITSDMIMLTCHMTINQDAVHDEVLKQTQNLLKISFHIEHSTVQIEREGAYCPNNNQNCF